MRGFQSIVFAGAMLAGAVLFTARPVLAGGGAQAGGKGMDHQHMNQMSMEGQSHGMAKAHGGAVTMASHHHFESLFLPDAVRLYVYDENQKPVMDLKGLKAKLTLESKDGKTQSVALDLLPPDEKTGRTQPCLAASHDFADMKPGTMKATFEVQGVAKDPVEFDMPVTMTPETFYTCSMHPDLRAEDPGECPECGMALTPVETGSDDGDGSGGMSHSGQGH